MVCRMFSSPPALYTLDASSPLPAMTAKYASRHCQMPLEVPESSPIQNHWVGSGILWEASWTNQRKPGPDGTPVAASCLYSPRPRCGRSQGNGYRIKQHFAKPSDPPGVIGAKVRLRHYVMDGPALEPHVTFRCLCCAASDWTGSSPEDCSNSLCSHQAPFHASSV